VFDQRGEIDFDRSFRRVDYFSALPRIRAQNNVQASVSSQPVDFLAVRVPADLMRTSQQTDSENIGDGVWIAEDAEKQALIVSRQTPGGNLELRYLPIRHLTQDRQGRLHFTPAEWSDDLPLRVWRDLPLPEHLRAAWLGEWHTDREWLNFFHATEYSNAVVSLHELFRDLPLEHSAMTTEAVIGRFNHRRRLNSRPDFVVFANDHWNFNFRGFNPGGNHGSFFRASTRATLMFAGGIQAGIPKGLRIDQPYDVLNFAPTILSLIGRPDALGPLPASAIAELAVQTP
jgi:hypothetical protein